MKDIDRQQEDYMREGGKTRGRGRHHHHGAQTFRRGRALDFLEKLNVKRMTLRQQLEAPEFQEIRMVIQGELKAIELVIEEFTKQFELHEAEKIKEQACRAIDGEDDGEED
ncbi:hypothetical protein PU629_18505 [Pullulanibacillus sp. KACC 23026]|uniref:hypothetical protein n=1 Tax=Pullulanibacillus sp. KACC 23026 TaxID=3028315 RepID=UPI0023AFC24F|nr:hypothetical protein [Pullulanibacillus sp. KACC 23026]WEG12091.1 hypothetical protein PU629_18505 [Pullulanibacillus sp. KACC 23026]